MHTSTDLFVWQPAKNLPFLLLNTTHQTSQHIPPRNRFFMFNLFLISRPVSSLASAKRSKSAQQGITSIGLSDLSLPVSRLSGNNMPRAFSVKNNKPVRSIQLTNFRQTLPIYKSNRFLSKFQSQYILLEKNCGYQTTLLHFFAKVFFATTPIRVPMCNRP